MNAVGYTRSLGQENGYSNADEQSAAIRKLCMEKGYYLGGIFQDDNGEVNDGFAPQFRNMLNQLLLKNTRTIIVESLDSISTNQKTQESLIVFLSSKGIQVVVCGCQDDELKIFLQKPINRYRVIMQREFTKFDRDFENVKRTYAREEIRKTKGKCEGRKSYGETAPEIIKEIRRLRRKRLGLKRRTFLEIATILNDSGRISLSGKKFTGNNVSVILHRLKAT